MNRTIQIFTVMLITIALAAGCATRARTGALTGAGLGALAGQTIGRDTESTLLGTGAGAGIGYIIGNEFDKNRARELALNSNSFHHTETAPLGGTRWKVVSMSPGQVGYRSKTIAFNENGVLTTTTTFADGSVDVTNERYRVSGGTLIINKEDYLVNAEYDLEGDELVLGAENWRAVLQRI